MKRVFFKTLIAGCIVTPVITAPLITTSCADVSIEITPSDRIKTVTGRDFSISFNVSRLTLHDVKVEIVDEKSGALSIVNDSIDTFIKYGEVDFHIDESVHYNKDFSFSLQFTVTRAKKVDVILVEGFKVYYNPSPEEWIDKIKIDSKVDEQTLSWDFNYDVQFSDMPLSPIEVNLVNDDSHMLSVKQKYVTVEKENQKYVAHIPVKLSLEVYENKVLPFDFYLDFTNSYGLSQHEKLTDMIASFKRKDTDVIPREYLDIREIETSNGNGTKWMYGFNPVVKNEAIQSYSALEIPDDVHGIAQYAFANQETCKNIERIVFKGKTWSVQDHVFVGCINITEFDISVFDNAEQLPPWLNPDVFVQLLFNPDDMTCLHPFMWVHSNIARETMEETGHLLGFAHPYILNPSAVFPDNFYNIVKDPLTGDNVLQNVNQGMLSQAKDYRIIRLPKGVNRIAEYALSPLSYYPYGGSTNQMPRILILNKELTTIEGENAFSYLGLSGPVYLPPNLKSIPKNTFSYATQYYDQQTLFSPDDYEFIINFNTAKNLTTIGDGAFANCNILTTTTGFQPSLNNEGSSVGSLIFQNCPRLNYLDFSYMSDRPTSGWAADAFAEIDSVKVSGINNFCAIPFNTGGGYWQLYLQTQLDTSIWTIDWPSTNLMAMPIRKEW